MGAVRSQYVDLLTGSHTSGSTSGPARCCRDRLGLLVGRHRLTVSRLVSVLTGVATFAAGQRRLEPPAQLPAVGVAPEATSTPRPFWLQNGRRLAPMGQV